MCVLFFYSSLGNSDIHILWSVCMHECTRACHCVRGGGSVVYTWKSCNPRDCRAESAFFSTCLQACVHVCFGRDTQLKYCRCISKRIFKQARVSCKYNECMRVCVCALPEGMSFNYKGQILPSIHVYLIHSLYFLIELHPFYLKKKK